MKPTAHLKSAIDEVTMVDMAKGTTNPDTRHQDRNQQNEWSGDLVLGLFATAINTQDEPYLGTAANRIGS